MITAELTVARLLDEHPESFSVLAEFHPHFKQLRHRLLRKVMAPRVTLGQAAKIAGVPIDDLLAALRRAAGEPDVPVATRTAATAAELPARIPKPPALAALAEAQILRLDVRDDIRRGIEPFARVMAAVKSLGAGQALVLRAPFEPIPLYDVLGKRGLSHWTDAQGAADWSVWFYRERANAPSAVEAPPRPATSHGTGSTLDVRGLEPPLPMVLVMEHAEALSAGEELVVLHERRPLFLYPQLEARGFDHETDEPEPGLVRIRIRRRTETAPP